MHLAFCWLIAQKSPLTIHAGIGHPWRRRVCTICGTASCRSRPDCPQSLSIEESMRQWFQVAQRLLSQ